MNGIGVVGAGIGGLHLSLLLQQHSVPVTLYAETAAREQLLKRLPNTAVHWRTTRERERTLGVNHWDGLPSAQPGTPLESGCMHVHVTLPAGTRQFSGNFAAPAITVDQRLITATLLEDFQDRGGEVVIRAIKADDLETLTERHEFVVLSTGRGSLTELFPRLAEHSPYIRPQRLLCTALYNGITYTDPIGIGFNVVAGVGELFELPIITADGPKTALFFEVVPGGPAELLMQARYQEDPAAFEANVIHVLGRYMPHVLERTQLGSFGVTHPLDVLQGAITPTIRRPYARLDNDRWVMAIADLHGVNDPLLGQGANAASHAAFTMGRAILSDGIAFDERFCLRTAELMWRHLDDVTSWNNHTLRTPLPDNVAQLLEAAHAKQQIADAFADGFAEPEAAWNRLASPERTQSWLRDQGCDPLEASIATPGPSQPR
jgi:hypothetical protein